MTLIPSIILRKQSPRSIDDGVVTILFWARSLRSALFWSLFLGSYKKNFRPRRKRLSVRYWRSRLRRRRVVVCCFSVLLYRAIVPLLAPLFLCFSTNFRRLRGAFSCFFSPSSSSLNVCTTAVAATPSKPTLKQNSVPKPVVQMSKVMIQTIYKYNKSKFLPFYFGFEAFESWF